jgi:uncharacterized membrane-anchored protein YjiN (DUF445 family)
MGKKNGKSIEQTNEVTLASVKDDYPKTKKEKAEHFNNIVFDCSMVHHYLQNILEYNGNQIEIDADCVDSMISSIEKSLGNFVLSKFNARTSSIHSDVVEMFNVDNVNDSM